MLSPNEVLKTILITIGAIAAGLLILTLFVIGVVRSIGSGYGDNPWESDGVIETDRVTFALASPPGRYQFDVAKNYVRSNFYLRRANAGLSDVWLWTLYPSFEGFSKTRADSFLREDSATSGLISLKLMVTGQTDAYFDQQFGRNRLQQMMALPAPHTLVPSPTPHPYPGFDEYLQSSAPHIKYYTFENENQLVIVECALTVLMDYCSAEKRWKNTGFDFKYTFRNARLSEARAIDTGINRFIESLNIQEIQRGK